MNARELLERYENGQLNDDDLFINRDAVRSALSLQAAAEANDGSTPETDALCVDVTMGTWEVFKVMREHARKLERSRSGLAAEVGRLREAAKAMADDGWLAYGPEGMSPAQALVYAAIDAERAGK
jgi:hypothetical protein